MSNITFQKISKQCFPCDRKEQKNVLLLLMNISYAYQANGRLPMDHLIFKSVAKNLAAFL